MLFFLFSHVIAVPLYTGHDPPGLHTRPVPMTHLRGLLSTTV
ncbi:hypothetical protein HMPREF0281_00326 [Corynebacterium ammoniagenes DSM 20306]|uniref:Uncharacterized protein n=1 Tax=Corynebacterium ammoniagenes DSM 20306 TaxID=649754 RepID=A0ABN0AHH2_CORAM|nr:hypothetical protein HMPREF0281_00326 [Corynebacterium ammoniagenes DSM 20306]